MSPFFLNCDWGTSHLRLRAVRSATVEVAAEYRSDQGAAGLAAAGQAGREGRFAAALTVALEQLSDRLDEPLGATPIAISGMASSSIGWHELPYAALPIPRDGSSLVLREIEPVASRFGSRRVLLVSGVRSENDVMRGEETQAIGLLSLPLTQPLATRSLVILPGTHSKHLHVRSGAIVSFQTFMTGELFALLTRHSILRHSVTAEPAGEMERGGQANAAFREGVELAGQLPLAAALFRVRTGQLLDGRSPDDCRSLLNGIVIGGELNDLRRNPSASGLPLILCATPPLDLHYREALLALGLEKQLLVVPAVDVERLSALGQAILLEKQGFF